MPLHEEITEKIDAVLRQYVREHGIKEAEAYALGSIHCSRRLAEMDYGPSTRTALAYVAGCPERKAARVDWLAEGSEIIEADEQSDFRGSVLA